jgi:predicted ATPase
MLLSITFASDHRCFKTGDKFEFRKGINFLVGDQGTGKSTLLGVSKKYSQHRENKEKSKFFAKLKFDQKTVTYFFDFERDNPRLQPRFSNNVLAEVSALFSSHGETTLGILSCLKNKKIKNATIFQDEPDGSLSVRSAYTVLKLFDQIVEEHNVQIIASVHNPLFIQHVPEVLSLEHRKWMPSEEFIRSQKEK